MPFFAPGDDPGASFPELLRRVGLAPGTVVTPSSGAHDVAHQLSIPHATTCVGVRYDGGVVMAGDRRATAGNLISHRSMEMVRLFQLQLEHYEKVEGSSLSLEGKANQLSMMVRGNLPAAMQGMVVVPIFGGFDLRREGGRLWDYDATGGRYEERDHVATGSGSLHATTVIKVGYREDMTRDDAINLAATALWEAADADSATGGPDALRGIYPVVASIDADGWTRLGDGELAGRYEAIVDEVRAR